MTDEQVKQMWLDGRHDELTEQLMGIAVKLATGIYQRTMVDTEVDQDDVVSWALESMWKAILSWDPDNGVPLRGWIAFRVPRDIKNIQRDAICQKRGGDQRRVPLEYLEYTSGSLGLGLKGLQHDSDPAQRFDDVSYSDIVRPDTNNRLAHAMLAVREEEEATTAEADVESLLKDLPKHQQQILRSLASGASLREIGEAMDMNHVWVFREAEKARAHMRASLS